MAECARKKLRACDIKALALAVECAYRYVHRSCYRTVFSGDRKATLSAFLRARVCDDFGIDKLNKLSRLCFYYDHSAENAYLRRGKSNTVRRAHSLCHIVKQSEYSWGYLINGAAYLSECIVTNLNYF